MVSRQEGELPPPLSDPQSFSIIRTNEVGRRPEKKGGLACPRLNVIDCLCKRAGGAERMGGESGEEYRRGDGHLFRAPIEWGGVVRKLEQHFEEETVETCFRTLENSTFYVSWDLPTTTTMVRIFLV